MRRFYFTLEGGHTAGMDDYIGNIRGACREAQAEADRIGEPIIVTERRTKVGVGYVSPRKSSKNLQDSASTGEHKYYTDYRLVVIDEFGRERTIETITGEDSDYTLRDRLFTDHDYYELKYKIDDLSMYNKLALEDMCDLHKLLVTKRIKLVPEKHETEGAEND